MMTGLNVKSVDSSRARKNVDLRQADTGKQI
jgi:hypothetical protein